MSCLQMSFSAPSPSPSLSVSPSPSPDATLLDGSADSAAADCDLMVLTTFFTTKRDWQRNISAPAETWMMDQFYESALETGIHVTVLYDELPQDILDYATDRFKFERVNLADYDAEEGLNDMRFSMVRDLVDRHPEWGSLFLVDLFDVKVGMNPCGQMMDQKLYIGKEPGMLHYNPWMQKRFESMGGKYESWFLNDVRRIWYLMNAGIIGGRREIFRNFLRQMTAVLDDPDLVARKHHEQENVNMAALNYVVRASMGLSECTPSTSAPSTAVRGGIQALPECTASEPGFIHGEPVHSEYKHFELDRKDVWFIHK